MTPATGDIGSRIPRVGLGRVLRAEWTKVRTVRSMTWTLVGSAAATVGFGAAIVASHLSDYARMSALELTSVDPVAESLLGLWFGLLGFVIFGLLVSTSEYATGTIRATLAAVPRRLPVLVAKAIVVALVTITVATVTSFASFFATQPILSRESLDTSLGEPGVLRAVLGGALFITGAALVGLGLGAVLRHAAATLAVVTVIFFLAPIIVELQPDSWAGVTRFLPHAAGSAMSSAHARPDLLSPLDGLAVFSGWIFTIFTAAGVLFQRRDA